MKLSGIGTYSGKGVLKHGCMPAEHAIVYLSGTDPASCYLPGEYGSGMTKMPIEIVPVDSSITLRRESRVRFGKTYPIEMNVKVKDIGRVEASQLGRLLRYWESEEGLFHVDSENFADEPRHGVLESKSTPDPDSDGEDVVLLKMDARYDLSADHMHSRLAGNLSSEYQVIQNPRGFFKKGIVFMVPWPEPGGDYVKDRVGPPVVVKIRRFVVIRPKNTFCLCLPIQTYGGQATTKPGVVPQDHAAIVAENDEVRYLPNEVELTKMPLQIRVENASTGPIDPASRINFAKVYTVEYNVKVWKVGRIIADSVWRLEQYFTECSKIGTS
ncbi:hypothetical protein AA0113_g2793 [Alternaria arborescens]|uniref:DUF6590 domain-containing protein n=1 Tax=Alternaria arborescens TaxID=156630 RepID=A0A4Q4SJ37_9PLEO|nr:hypothetical protein AA0111_g8260 [Alternaria arborescens]RYO26263.1 hypothetical protein AA0111_g8260 [Alternaria arborescens]RYO70690.1 hypothetical protein AA0113_g2793 [Alternaria arborescens]